ncbi:MAG: amino acid ABC transporter substrate-binding protein [Thiogranum sp.]|nr:amino acid ABC transporter substrate-binding protein [Thiogranum sp.]
MNKIPGTWLARLFGYLLLLIVIDCHAMTTQEPPIRVGVTVSLSGEYAVSGKLELEGIRMWVHDINQRGALLGQRVELVYYDDKSEPATSATLYERLITQDKVDLLLGPYGSNITMAASTVAEQHNFPMVATGAASADIWARGYHNIFGVDAQAGHYMDLLIESAAAAGLKTIAMVYGDSDFPRNVAAGVRVRAAAHDMQIVFERQYHPENADYAALVKAMKATHPDLVIGGTYLDDSMALVRAAKAADFSPKAFAFTVGPALKRFVDELGADANGMLGIVAWMRSAAMPMAMDFSYRYKERFGHNASYVAALGYGGAQVLEAAVRLAGSLDKDAIRTQLSQMKFRSILGNYQVDATGKQIAKYTYVMQVQNGWRLLVLPKSLQESKVEYPFKPWSER